MAEQQNHRSQLGAERPPRLEFVGRSKSAIEFDVLERQRWLPGDFGRLDCFRRIALNPFAFLAEPEKPRRYSRRLTADVAANFHVLRNSRNVSTFKSPSRG